MTIILVPKRTKNDLATIYDCSWRRSDSVYICFYQEGVKVLGLVVLAFQLPGGLSSEPPMGNLYILSFRALNKMSD